MRFPVKKGVSSQTLKPRREGPKSYNRTPESCPCRLLSVALGRNTATGSTTLSWTATSEPLVEVRRDPLRHGPPFPTRPLAVSLLLYPSVCLFFYASTYLSVCLSILLTFILTTSNGPSFSF